MVQSLGFAMVLGRGALTEIVEAPVSGTAIEAEDGTTLEAEDGATLETE